MDNINNSNKELIFSDNAEEILLGVLKKYKLDETDDEVFKKLEGDQPFFGEIVTDATRNLFTGSIKESELSSLLKDKLNMSKESAEALALDIKQQLLPLIKEVEVPAEEQAEEIKDVDIFPIIKPTEAAEKIQPEIQPAVSPQKIKKPLPVEEKAVEQRKKPSGPDTYREPIE